jgi:hypothetical protein
MSHPRIQIAAIAVSDMPSSLSLMATIALSPSLEGKAQGSRDAFVRNLVGTSRRSSMLLYRAFN